MPNLVSVLHGVQPAQGLVSGDRHQNGGRGDPVGAGRSGSRHPAWPARRGDRADRHVHRRDRLLPLVAQRAADLPGRRSQRHRRYLSSRAASRREFYSLADYDTDYSFNLLLWPFVPSDELPQSFVDNQWSSAARAQLIADWPTLFPTIPWSGEVPAQVDLILPQQPMATLGLGMAGQDAPHDEPVPQPATAPFQHFLMHCEIEGPGMHELLRLLYMLLAGLVFVLAASALPGVGWIITGILALLALLLAALGGNAIMNEQATPPQGGKWGGWFNSYEDADGDGGPVDIAYVVGRFVYNSFHIGSESNELHPVHFMIKLKTRHPVTKGDIAGGKWPPGLGEQKAKLDAQFQIINSPATIEVQRRPENRWKLHPLLDGCTGGDAISNPTSGRRHPLKDGPVPRESERWLNLPRSPRRLVGRPPARTSRRCAVLPGSSGWPTSRRNRGSRRAGCPPG